MVSSDIIMYWESISGELEATKNRVRNLIGQKHWLTDGTHKELLLRSVLQRHLPEELKVCTGFIYKNSQISSQVDILIINKSGYTLFKEGDLVIVTPHAVRSIIEVKTTLEGNKEIEKVLTKIAQNTNLAEQELVQHRGPVLSSLFIYEQNADEEEKQQQMLKAIAKIDSNNGGMISSVVYGPDIFIKFYSTGGPGPMWISHYCEGLAAGCFVIDILASLTKNPGNTDFQTLNSPTLSGKVKPTFYINRGCNEVKKVESND